MSHPNPHASPTSPPPPAQPILAILHPQLDAPSTRRYVIIEGVVKVVGRDADMQKIDVCEFGAGAIVGEMEFLHDHDTVADVGLIWALRFRLGVRAGVRVQSKEQGWACTKALASRKSASPGCEQGWVWTEAMGRTVLKGQHFFSVKDAPPTSPPIPPCTLRAALPCPPRAPPKS